MCADALAIVSVHDVMPETLDRVDAVLNRLESAGVGPCTLLVVPGRAWTNAGILLLHAWRNRGHRLAAHGWCHHVDSIRGWPHRLHSALLSRRVAEHLALDSRGILDLMIRASDWFPRHDLPRPDLYVPPAWALGPLRPEDRLQAPYRTIEVLRGLLDTASGRLQPMPLVGFEADTRLRQTVVGLWNRVQEARARRIGAPLRIGLHPRDFELRLAREADAILRRSWRFTQTPVLMSPDAGRAKTSSSTC